MSLGVALTLAGCGSSGGGGGGYTAPTGTLAGDSFTPAGTMAVVYAPAVCTGPGGSESDTRIGLMFTNVPSVCSGFLAARCDNRANMTAVVAFVQRYKQSGATTALTAGIYPLTLTAPVADANGNYTNTFISYQKFSATCAVTVTSGTATAGGVTIGSISATRVTGSISATFSDGSSYSGAFDVPVCADPMSVCSGCSGAPACVP
jgi:hypothetical protein